MRGHWLAGPDRANRFGCVVTDRENEIEGGSIWTRELVPAFTAETPSGHVRGPELRERFRMHRSC